MAENPYSSSLYSDDELPGGDDLSWQSVTAPLKEAANWHRFLGYSLIAVGVLFGMTVIGVVVGWIPVWIGILLLKSADNLRTGTAQSTNQAIGQLAKIIRIAGYSGLALLVLFVLYCVGLFVIISIYGVAPIP